MFKLILFLALLQTFTECTQLYPRESETREIISLDGLWSFYLNREGIPNNNSLSGNDNDKDVFLMAVPSSYNDILTARESRDYVGEVSYERTFFVPYEWKDYYRIWIRFGSVCHYTNVYVNQELVATHTTGHLPFIADVTLSITAGENTIKVVANNILSDSTLPQGVITNNAIGEARNTYQVPFFNYAGIERSVVLYKTPNGYVEDITLTTTVSEKTGIVDYEIFKGGASSVLDAIVTILDQDGKEVYSHNHGQNTTGQATIENANLWWPYLMSETPAYLYTFRVELKLIDDLIDVYELPFGIRELSWSEKSFLINGKPIYFRGFSRHEDSDFRGKGLDLPVIIRDHNLIRWIGSNSYRTSNYPYSEEVMDVADQLGIMIINESPAANLYDYSNPQLLKNHMEALSELYTRDKNRPSVVMWSIAADPVSSDEAEVYFRNITEHIKQLDSTRPITIPTKNSYDKDKTTQYADIVSFNKYEAWEEYTGDLDVIVTSIVETATGWHDAYKKPVLITEYGSDTQEGYHSLPEYAWSEEYQEKLLSKHFEAFDNLKQNGWFIGEMLFNFADFRSPQTIYSVGGNKKGIFTRQRQPKSSAYVVRKRYWELAQKLDNATAPADLDPYTTPNNHMVVKDEL